MLLKKSIKALLQSYPGLYRDMLEKILEILDGKSEKSTEVFRSVYLDLIELELQFYVIVHPLQPRDDQYSSSLLAALIKNGLLLIDEDSNKKFL